MPEKPLPRKADPPIWTVHDVALYLRISDAKVYRLIKARQIPVVRIGKAWRFRKDWLDTWLVRCAELSVKRDGK